ncbi:MAG: hypothetical protein ACK5PF_05985 [bacterium]|jgi:hypothetical protein
MLPLSRLTEYLKGYQAEFNQQFDELIQAAEIVARKTNVIEREDNGQFLVQATGTLDQVIDTLETMLKKLYKIKENTDDRKQI